MARTVGLPTRVAVGFTLGRPGPGGPHPVPGPGRPRPRLARGLLPRLRLGAVRADARTRPRRGRSVVGPAPRRAAGLHRRNRGCGDSGRRRGDRHGNAGRAERRRRTAAQRRSRRRWRHGTGRPGRVRPARGRAQGRDRHRADPGGLPGAGPPGDRRPPLRPAPPSQEPRRQGAALVAPGDRAGGGRRRPAAGVADRRRDREPVGGGGARVRASRSRAWRAPWNGPRTRRSYRQPTTWPTRSAPGARSMPRSTGGSPGGRGCSATSTSASCGAAIAGPGSSRSTTRSWPRVAERAVTARRRGRPAARLLVVAFFVAAEPLAHPSPGAAEGLAQPVGADRLRELVEPGARPACGGCARTAARTPSMRGSRRTTASRRSTGWRPGTPRRQPGPPPPTSSGAPCGGRGWSR